MCGRYQFTAEQNDEIRAIIRNVQRNSDHEKWSKGEICPSALAPVLVARGNKVTAELQSWGMTGFRAGLIINAKAETVQERAMFRTSIQSRRCVVPTTGFFEWDADKHKYLFRMPGQGATYLAGIYDAKENINCFVILTTAPNASVSNIHDRMPLVLEREAIRPWLTEPDVALQLLAQQPPLLERVPLDGQLSLWN